MSEPSAVVSKRKGENEDTTQESWKQHKKHFFILSHSGKPIYTRYGDEMALASFFAVMQAIVSTFQDFKTPLQSVKAGNRRFVFYTKGPIFVVVVSKTGQEPIQQLLKQCEYMYSQIIATLTLPAVERMFSNRSRYDLRMLIGGTEKILDSLASHCNHDLSLMMDGIQCLSLPVETRNIIGNTLLSARTPNLFYAILSAGTKLVQILKPKKHTISHKDLHLLFNFVNASSSLRSSESWAPLCLPNFNSQGFLHAYVCFLQPEVCLTLLSTQAEGFYELAEAKAQIQQSLSENGSLSAISKAMKYKISVGEIGIPELQHFVFKNLLNDTVIVPAFENQFAVRQEKKRLIRIYQNLHEKMTTAEQKFYYHASQLEVVIGWSTDAFLMYATFGALVPKQTTIRSCNMLSRWLKSREQIHFIPTPNLY